MSEKMILSDIECQYLRIEQPDPFVVSFPGENAIHFFKDGRIEAKMDNANEAAKVFVDCVGEYFHGAIAEAVAAERERCAKLVKAEITAFVGDRRQFIKKAEAREILKSLRQDIRAAAP